MGKRKKKYTYIDKTSQMNSSLHGHGSQPSLSHLYKYQIFFLLPDPLPPSLSLDFSISTLLEFSKMAAFSYQHHPSLLDSIFLPNSPIKMSLMADMNASCFSYYPSNAFPLHQSCSPENSTSPSLAENRLDSLSSIELKADSSSVVVELENSDYLPKQGSVVSRKRKSRNPNCPNSAQSKDSNQGRGRKVKKCSISSKAKADKKGLEEPPSGYIHVRARRGQATDSHSLAERVRREKISKRMKLLQSLVPGCDTVNSKALMLDEIINYVQSLQNQVEFLSMKLASVNPVFYDPASEDVEEYAAQTQKLWSSSFQLPNSNHETAFEGSTSNTFHATTNNHPLLESTPTTILFHGQRSSNAYSQDNANLLWEAEEKRQRFINPAGYTNLCSFH